MIKFFRKIRYDLMEKNKTGKYFKYALGEIVLVVIGILIALQINNWNENRKLDEKRKDYYNQLIDDLKKDKALLIDNISKTDSIKSSYSVYLETFNQKGLTIDEMINNLFKLKLSASLINFNSSTFESLEKSGEIKIIPKELRNKILDLNRKQKLLEERIKGNSVIQVDFIKEYFLAIGSKSLTNRLIKHPEIEDYFKNEINRPKAILALESNMSWKIATEKSKDFKEILLEIDNTMDLISLELNK
jgi:hypothetical protein